MSTRQFSDELISRLGRVNAAIEADEGLTSEIGAMPSSLFLATGLTPPMVPSTVAEDVSLLVKELCQKRCQAFARIVQCLSDQYGHRDIETLSADQLAAMRAQASERFRPQGSEQAVEVAVRGAQDRARQARYSRGGSNPFFISNYSSQAASSVQRPASLPLAAFQPRNLSLESWSWGRFLRAIAAG
jgi:hypothetical protein